MSKHTPKNSENPAHHLFRPLRRTVMATRESETMAERLEQKGLAKIRMCISPSGVACIELEVGK
jgi:hypothetical protein